jgi:hypothetical protein
MTGTMLFDALDHAIARVEEHTGEALEVRLGVYDLTVEEVRALIAERWDRYAADYPPLPPAAHELFARSFIEALLTGLQYREEQER